MTVAELIEALKQFPLDSEVRCATYDAGFTPIYEVILAKDTTYYPADPRGADETTVALI